MTADKEILFVLSDVRSGSTLIDQLLGAHAEVTSLGELHWLGAYATDDRSLYNPIHPLVCTCGSRVTECVFWSKVADELQRPFESLQYRLRGFRWRGNDPDKVSLFRKLRQMPRRLIEKYPSLFKHPSVQRCYRGGQLARDNMALYEAIFNVVQSRFLIDSSKSSFRFKAIYDRHPERARALIISRDFRAVVHSKVKRGHSIETAAIGWRRKMAQIHAMTAALPADRKYWLTYEALCRDPEKELRQLCAFLDLEFSPAMLQRPTSDVHHIGGSPSKFDAARVEISLDTSHEGAFTDVELDSMRSLVGEQAGIWGYG